MLADGGSDRDKEARVDGKDRYWMNSGLAQTWIVSCGRPTLMNFSFITAHEFTLHQLHNH